MEGETDLEKKNVSPAGGKGAFQGEPPVEASPRDLTPGSQSRSSAEGLVRPRRPAACGRSVVSGKGSRLRGGDRRAG